jgi:hypothetical protein
VIELDVLPRRVLLDNRHDDRRRALRGEFSEEVDAAGAVHSRVGLLVRARARAQWPCA